MSASVVDMLRRQLREKFPQACGMAVVPAMESSVAPTHPGGRDGTSCGSVPLAVWGADGGVGAAAGLSEVTGIGAGWVVAALLEDAREEPGVPELVLVDGADGFDPASFATHVCARMLWVRCRKSAMEMVKAADWVVRDGNVPQVVVDAAGLDRHELASIPASAWWRLRQGAEQTGCRLIVVAASRLVPAAGRRWRATSRLGLADFAAGRAELLGALRMTAENAQQVKFG